MDQERKCRFAWKAIPSASMRDAGSSKLLDHLRSHVIAYLALFLALGGTSAWAASKITSEDIAKDAVRAKQIKKNAVKTSEIAKRAVTADKLAEGVQSIQGPPGQDATNLFAYVIDNGGAPAASVQYGSGVTAVSDAAGEGGAYRLTFDRSVVNCVVHAVPGYGDPGGTATGEEDAVPFVAMDNGGPDEVDVFFENVITDTGTDTSFFVTAFC
jgi:hypothetical protein